MFILVVLIFTLKLPDCIAKKYTAAMPFRTVLPLGEQHMPFIYPFVLIIETRRQNILWHFFPCGKKNRPFGETTFLPGAGEAIFVP